MVLCKKETTTPMAENTAPLRNITSNDHPLNTRPVPIGIVREKNSPSCIKPTETALR